MPSPIGHALGGVAAGLLLLPPGTRRLRMWAAVETTLPAAGLVAVVAAAGVLPDVDFLWGRHNMETHSLGAAAMAGAVAWLLARRGWRTRETLEGTAHHDGGSLHARGPLLIGLAVAAAWTTHVLFDCLGSDDTPPIGVMALWPLTSDFYLGDVGFFDAISRRYWLPNFWSHNLGAVVKEALVLLPLCALAAFSRALRGPSHQVDTRGRPRT